MLIFYPTEFLVTSAHQNLISVAIVQLALQKNILERNWRRIDFSLFFSLEYALKNLTIRALENRKKEVQN